MCHSSTKWNVGLTQSVDDGQEHVAFACPVCGLKFNGIRPHTLHYDDMEDAENDLAVCIGCGFVFVTLYRGYLSVRAVEGTPTLPYLSGPQRAQVPRPAIRWGELIWWAYRWIADDVNNQTSPGSEHWPPRNQLCRLWVEDPSIN